MTPVFITFTTPKGFYVYDRNKNSILSITEGEFSALNLFISGTEEENALRTIGRLQEEGYLLPHTVKEIKHYTSNHLHHYINRKTEKITLQVTQNCNLRCDYCAYSGSYINRVHSAKRMSFETAKKCIDYLFDHSCEKSSINIGFYGGEPLLELGLIKKCVEYVKSTYSEKQYDFTITTNGTLLTDDVVEYLLNNRFSVTISMDGPREIHDAHRRYPNGHGSFDIVMENMKRIMEKYPEHHSRVAINTVVSPESDFGCVVNFYDTESVLSSYSTNLNLVSEYGHINGVTYNEAFYIKSCIERMKAMLWVLDKLDKSKVSSLFLIEKSVAVRTANNLSYIDAMPESCHPGGPCIAGVKRLFCDVDGNLYPCERTSESSGATRIGHIDTGIDVDKARCVMNVGELTKDICANCWGFLHCSICAAAVDDGQCLSRELKMARCPAVLNDILDKFKDYCFFTEHGIAFEGLRGDNNA